MNRTRVSLFVLTVVLIATSIFSFVFFDNNFFIRKWNLPLDPPGFLDSRQFAWASESYAKGYDPLVENPTNPRGHQLNYPRVWHVFFPLGINESHTNIIGTIVVILFFIGISTFWFARQYGNLTYFMLTVALLSSAVMLGVERSNIELVIFFVLSIALLINRYSSVSALLIVIFAYILKLYPVFGLFYLLKENKKRFWTLFLVAFGIFVLYGVLTLNDFMHVYKTTPKLVNSSFGLHVWWMGLGHGRLFALPLTESVEFIFKVISYIVALVILAVTISFSLRNKHPVYYRQGEHLDAFRVGAGIFIGCFLLINSHDYRLIFLIFTVPQLVEWLRDKDKRFSFLPFATLTAIMLSLWSFFIMRFLGRKATFVLEELSNWIIFYGLTYLFLASVPEWFFDNVRQLLPEKKLKGHEVDSR